MTYQKAQLKIQLKKIIIPILMKYLSLNQMKVTSQVRVKQMKIQKKILKMIIYYLDHMIFSQNLIQI